PYGACGSRARRDFGGSSGDAGKNGEVQSAKAAAKARGEENENEGGALDHAENRTRDGGEDNCGSGAGDGCD
ncbi:MAG TPA: hypothetical protein VGU64_03960, partial [Terriglobales bacterium]|nr:hypothetical protein [Terriglobales bacterium]